MAKSYFKAGNKERALEYYFLYLKEMPRDAEACYQIAELLSSDEPKLAYKYLERSAFLGYKKTVEKINTLKAASNKEKEEKSK